MSNNNSIEVNIYNEQSNMFNDLIIVEIYNEIYNEIDNDNEIDNEIINNPLIVLYNTFQRNIFNQNGLTINSRNLINTIDFFNNFINDEITEDRLLDIALTESLNHYKTQEKKPNIKLCIEGYILNNDMKDENCTICVTKYQIGENIIELNCKHIFHIECISEWVKYKSECPVCRQSIDTVDERIGNN